VDDATRFANFHDGVVGESHALDNNQLASAIAAWDIETERKPMFCLSISKR